MKPKKHNHEKSLAEIGFEAHAQTVEREFNIALPSDYDTLPNFMKEGWEAAANAIETAVSDRIKRQIQQWYATLHKKEEDNDVQG